MPHTHYIGSMLLGRQLVQMLNDCRNMWPILHRYSKQNCEDWIIWCSIRFNENMFRLKYHQLVIYISNDNELTLEWTKQFHLELYPACHQGDIFHQHITYTTAVCYHQSRHMRKHSILSRNNILNETNCFQKLNKYSTMQTEYEANISCGRNKTSVVVLTCIVITSAWSMTKICPIKYNIIWVTDYNKKGRKHRNH